MKKKEMDARYEPVTQLHQLKNATTELTTTLEKSIPTPVAKFDLLT